MIAYMDIGTTNISAMIGPYMAPLTTATEKFGIPYFVVGQLQAGRYQPFNILSVFPNPQDIVLVAVEVASTYKWNDVAVIYDNMEGKFCMTNCLINEVSNVTLKSFGIQYCMLY